ncbi:pimeloyl-CoA dehydrogenase small subunit [Betaproteobacteria bacterium GR16-43]|nr:pimeloyl-CoA dehydrogenase small subunit [Betaproteobacteria bacterium GR16-43]
MDFNLTPEQGMLQDSLRKFLSKEYGFESRRARAASPEGFSRETWAQLAELGLLGIAIPEDDGGLGGDAFDTMVVMEALGRALVVEPYVSTVVLGGGTLAAAGSASQKEAWLPAIVGGEKLMAFAHGEPRSRYALAHVETTAKRDGTGWKLDGKKAVVRDAPSADAILVSARTAGGAQDEGGISLFLVDAKAKGVSMRGYATQDGGRAAEVSLSGVAVGADSLVGAADGAFPILERTVDRGIAALCAEALGIIDALNEATLEYLKTRQQFGQPIGRFQALQHRMVDMTIRAVETRSMAIVAAAGANHPDQAQRRRMVSAAKAHIGQGARYVGQQAVQLHGGIGVTDELIVSHWFKRLAILNATFGDAEHHLGLFSDRLLGEKA